MPTDPTDDWLGPAFYSINKPLPRVPVTCDVVCTQIFCGDLDIGLKEIELAITRRKSVLNSAPKIRLLRLRVVKKTKKGGVNKAPPPKLLKLKVNNNGAKRVSSSSGTDSKAI